MGISFPNTTLANTFAGTPFQLMTLTAHINRVDYVPNFLGTLPGLFFARGVSTKTIGISERGGALEVVGTSPRGSEPETTTHAKARMKPAEVSHVAIQDIVTADEVQDAINSANMMGQSQLQSVTDAVYERMEGPLGLRARIELTHEYHRMGGIHGVVVDKDGSELYNWYDFFGIAPPDPLNVNFGALTADGGTFEKTCTAWVRLMTDALEGLPVTAMRPVALCGDNYYDEIYSNKEVKAARKNRDTGRDSDVFTQTKAYTSFEYGGITWVNYRGTKDGKVGIDKEKARLFPFGVPGLFQMIFGPPDIMGHTNMPGAPVFAHMPLEKQTSRQATMEAQSNPLTLCLRPGALFELTK